MGQGKQGKQITYFRWFSCLNAQLKRQWNNSCVVLSTHPCLVDKTNDEGPGPEMKIQSLFLWNHHYHCYPDDVCNSIYNSNFSDKFASSLTSSSPSSSTTKEVSRITHYSKLSGEITILRTDVFPCFSLTFYNLTVLSAMCLK